MSTVANVIYLFSITQGTSLLKHDFVFLLKEHDKVNMNLEAWWLLCEKWHWQCMVHTPPYCVTEANKTKDLVEIYFKYC